MRSHSQMHSHQSDNPGIVPQTLITPALQHPGIASDLTTRRTTRASSKQPESILPEHGATTAQNIVKTHPTQAAPSADTQQTTEPPRHTMSSTGITKRVMRATSRQAEHTLLGPMATHAGTTLVNCSSELSAPTNAPSSIHPRPPGITSNNTTMRTTRGSSKQLDGTSWGDTAVKAKNALRTTPSETSARTVVAGIMPPYYSIGMEAKQSLAKKTKRMERRTGQQREAKTPLCGAENAAEKNHQPSTTQLAPPPGNTRRTTRATSKQREPRLSALNAPEMVSAAKIPPQDASGPTNHARTTDPHLPRVPFISRTQRTTPGSSRKPENTISGVKGPKPNNATDEPAAEPSALAKRTASTAADHLILLPVQSRQGPRRRNSKQPELKMPLATITELENTSGINPALQAPPALPPRQTTKQTTRGNSKQSEHKAPPATAVDDDNPPNEHPPRSITPTAPAQPNKKRETPGNSKQREHRPVGPITPDVDRSSTSTVFLPSTASTARATSSTETSTRRTTAPRHPDPYFNQPLSLIIQRTKPPPHATASALPGSAFSCSMCPSIVHGAANSIRHLRTHDGVEVQCRLCDKEFRTSDSLKGHWTRHHPEEPRVWIIGELKSFYKDWSKSGVEKWCGEWKGVVGGAATAKGENTAESKPTKRKRASDDASSAESSVAVDKGQQTASGTTAAVPTGKKGPVTPKVSAQVVEVPEAADEVLMTAVDIAKYLAMEDTSNVEHAATAKQEKTQVLNKKRKTAEDTTAREVNSKKHRPSTAQGPGSSKPQLPIKATKRTTRTVPSKAKNSTTTSLPLVQDVKQVVVADKLVADKQVESETKSANAMTECDKSAAAEKKTTTKKMTAKKVAKEIIAPRTLRKRKGATEKTAEPVDIKKRKVLKNDAPEDRLLMPPPVLRTMSLEPPREANIDDAADPEIERRRILAQALRRFQVHLVPPKPLDTNTAGEIGNNEHQKVPQADKRGNNEAAELSEDSDDDLYSVRRVGNCRKENPVADAIFEQVVDAHVEAYTKRISG